MRASELLTMGGGVLAVATAALGEEMVTRGVPADTKRSVKRFWMQPSDLRVAYPIMQIVGAFVAGAITLYIVLGGDAVFKTPIVQVLAYLLLVELAVLSWTVIGTYKNMQSYLEGGKKRADAAYALSIICSVVAAVSLVALLLRKSGKVKFAGGYHKSYVPHSFRGGMSEYIDY